MDDRNVLTHLFLSHPKSIVMLRAWHHVIVIDATYKTNKYDMPWVEIVGMTLVGLNFVNSSTIVYDEMKESYQWLLTHLQHLLGPIVPDVFVSDKAGGLVGTVGVMFPSSTHILCLWHIDRNVRAKCLAEVRTTHCGIDAAKPTVDHIMVSWQRAVYALIEEDMDTTLDNFRRSWGVQGVFGS
ncbi:unnamed protein product [Linum trigynum]|uniref:MULE transposase domain-containing protein n=1 Tax=Linum trigynum TaxID=586398 RepID=A0AAV2GG13_9ROSI